MRLIVTGLLLWWAVAAVGAATGPPTLSVLDFETAPGSPQDGVWAARAIPDLLQVHLQEYKVALLDRQLVHALLTEQRLATSGRIAGDSLSVGKLLGSQYLIAGSFVVNSAGVFRLSTKLVNAEDLRVQRVTSHGGRYPKELDKALAAAARELAASLGKPSAPAKSPSPTDTSVNVEAMLMFHRGLHACAQDAPEVGALWFGKAAKHDPRLLAASLWEIKAYDLTGLADYAALSRELFTANHRGFTNALIQPAACRDDVRSVAVMELAVLPGVDAAAMRIRLEQAVLTAARTQLVGQDALAAAATETDLNLSGQMMQPVRYGGWSLADALLCARQQRAPDGRDVWHLYLVDALRGETLARREWPATGAGPDTPIAAAVRTLLDEHPPPNAAAANEPGLADTLPPLDSSLTKGLLVDEINLANHLRDLRRNPGNRDVLYAMLRVYSDRNGGQPDRYTALIANRLIDTLDPQAGDADILVYEAFSRVPNGQPHVDTEKLAAKITTFTKRQPRSVATAMIRYARCYDLWRRQQSGELVVALDEIIPVLAATTPEDSFRLFGGARPNPVDRALAGCYYLRGKQTAANGHTARALADFAAGLALFEKDRLSKTETLAGAPATKVVGDHSWLTGSGVSDVKLYDELLAERNRLQPAAAAANVPVTQPRRAPQEKRSTPNAAAPSRTWRDWFNDASRQEREQDYEQAAALFRMALEAGQPQYGWATTPDHTWTARLPNHYMGREPERLWYNVVFHLATCLAHTRPEEAAPWLRMISFSIGNRSLYVCQAMLPNGIRDCRSLPIGEIAAQTLSNLHQQAASPSEAE